MTAVLSPDPLPADLFQALREYRLGDPYLLLGPQATAEGFRLRAWRPEARECWVGDEEGPTLEMQHVGEGLFEWGGIAEALPQPYRLHWRDVHGEWRDALDPYAFREPLIADFDLHLFGQGRHWNIHDWLGAHPLQIDGVDGVRFAVWAPHATRVSVVGDFNAWDGRVHLMRGTASGVWQLFVPELVADALYKYEIRSAEGEILLKADPYARRCQLRPETASQVVAKRAHAWTDESWLARRRKRDALHAPLSIYEVHLGSWQRDEHGGFLNYREIAHRLAAYARWLGFTHIELLPVSEHPFDGSWGYQTIGLYAPTSRHGTPDDFRYFVDHCHAKGLGVILDWVPAHFPKDAHGLARFDGQPLYEYPDPLRGEHPEWGTLVYDYGRPQVRNLLIANALYWFEEFHIDGLRVDAVASMLCLDYGREPGQWKPNAYGGREHLEAVQFLRDLNTVVHGQYPGAMVIAEESTSWPQVSRPVNHSAPAGGLGFTMKWDLGWMHDSLDYFMQDPIYRRHHQQKITFGLMYAWNENFVLPLSHDEVVHLKKSLIDKMPGDEWQQFANLRLLYGWMWTRPGKKLLFMGGEFGQRREWNHDRPLDWWHENWSWNAGLRQWVGDLNRIYSELPALHELDFDSAGFEWIDCHNADESVFVYRRRDRAGHEAVMVINATPVPRHGYRVGLPRAGLWSERLNSDAVCYGGSGVGNQGSVLAQNRGFNNQPCSAQLTLPPLGILLLTPG